MLKRQRGGMDEIEVCRACKNGSELKKSGEPW